jgi:tetratricopeptide (TPR) repeat protein
LELWNTYAITTRTRTQTLTTPKTSPMASTPQPTVQQVREELDRLLEDSTFRRAPSHSRLLRYLVERKTAGDDGALCEAGIAILLTEVTREFPDSADAWALRGRSCVRRINYGDLPASALIAELQECARTAIALNPNHIEAQALGALVLHWTGMLAQAETQFRNVLRAAPNHTSARLGFAWLLVAQGRFDEVADRARCREFIRPDVTQHPVQPCLHSVPCAASRRSASSLRDRYACRR